MDAVWEQMGILFLKHDTMIHDTWHQPCFTFCQYLVCLHLTLNTWHRWGVFRLMPISMLHLQNAKLNKQITFFLPHSPEHCLDLCNAVCVVSLHAVVIVRRMWRQLDQLYLFISLNIWLWWSSNSWCQWNRYILVNMGLSFYSLCSRSLSLMTLPLPLWKPP